MVTDEDDPNAIKTRDILKRMANKFITNSPDLFTTATPGVISLGMGTTPVNNQGKPYLAGLPGMPAETGTTSNYSGFTVLSSAGKGMAAFLGEDSRGKKFLEDLNENSSIYRNYTINVRHDGAATVFEAVPVGDEKAYVPGALKLAGNTRLNSVLSYCTSQQRSTVYVYHQEENTPGCYDHQKSMGMSLEILANILTAAENAGDMEVLENLTRANGNYKDVLNRSSDSLSDSANNKIVEYVFTLQASYANTGNYVVQTELDALNEFYVDTENKYSQGYFERYFDKVMEYMPVEQKVDVWISTDYVMSEEEMKEAEAYLEAESERMIKEGGISWEFYYATDCEQEHPEYQKLFLFHRKVDTHQAFGTAATAPFEKLGLFIGDAGVDIFGTMGEMGAGAVDDMLGTEYRLDVMNWEESAYAKNDAKRQYINHAVDNAKIQHPQAAFWGNIAGNALLYIATAPFFEVIGAAMGAESALGLFLVNQAGQNAQDLLIDTRDVYERLSADGELSQDDKNIIVKNIGTNAAWNLGMGIGGELIGKGLKYAGEVYDVNKGVKLAEEYLNVANKTDFVKGLSNNDLIRMLGQVDDNAAKEVLSLCGDDVVNEVLKHIDPAQAKRIVGAVTDPVGVEGKNVLQNTVNIEGFEYKEVCSVKAEEANQWFVDNVKPDYKPPYKPGTVVDEIELTENTTFVRVYDNEPGGSGMYGSWVMRAEDIDGLTPLEIQEKFALPSTPKYVCDVELDKGIHLRRGEVNPLEGWGAGGGTQYDLIGQRTGTFTNERLLEIKQANGGRLIPGIEGVVTGGDSTKLGKNMMEAMGVPRGTRWPGHQAQHIVPAELADHPILQKIGMDLDDPSNGLFLRVPGEDISTMSRHRGYHSTYNEFVKKQLDAMDINQSVEILQKQVYDLQQDLKYLQQKGLPLYPSQGATLDLWQRSIERIH